ncbi:MAG TPA: ABC transporter ATP-binding protein [Burkholderiales bacterium]|nr:ABC transporter ATP-binding protein [Burkholderiales bacterium]
MTAVLLDCRQLTVRFGGLAALNKLSIQVGSGEILGLIGPNGSGKTTFFNALTGLYRLDEGRVVFAGRDITGFRPQAVHACGIARTFQRSRLCLTLSVFDNLMIGNHRRLSLGFAFNLLRRKRFAAQLGQEVERASTLLSGFHRDLPARLFEPAAALGMIDRRRVEVCRALIGEPKLLLLDEPSAGMTHDETHELMDDILAARARLPGLSIVLIEHEMGVIERITDRCAVLNFGEKICEGAYEEVVADRRVQEAYLGVE